MAIENIKVEAMVAYYGEDAYQVQSATFKPDVSGSLQSKAFLFYTPANVAHYIWFNLATLGTDPAIAGATGHAVAGALNDTAATLASAAASVIGAVTGFDASASGKVVTITNTDLGYAPPLRDPATGASGFGFKTITQGDLKEAVGCVEGEIALTFAENMIDVKCHDTGSTIITQLKSGWGSIELAMALQETTLAKLKKMFVKAGGSFLPVGVGATELFGIGTAKQFENAAVYAKKLTLHPARLLANDVSEDWTVWKAYPMLEGATFSGEKVFTLPVKFKAYLDESKPKEIQYLAIGDATQSLI